jgi:uncharacterized membrane protein YhaH (DUF805 family)
MEDFLAALRRYADFAGRSRRREYWMFTLINLVGFFTLSFGLTLVFGVGSGIANTLPLLFWLALLIPGLAVAVRRLHDTDRSGWWFLLVFVPLIGGIVLLVWFCTAGVPGSNQYGTDPKVPGME